MPAYKRILLKLSGEALMGDDAYGINRATIVRMVREVAGGDRSWACEVAVVIGGGNIFRGVAGGSVGMDRATADYMGMLATVMNALALADTMRQAGHDRARDVGHRHRAGGRALRAAQGAAVPRRRQGRDLRGRHRQPVLHHRHRGGAARRRDRRRDRAQGDQGRRRLHAPTRRRTRSATRYASDQLRRGDRARTCRCMDATAFALCRDQKLPIKVFSHLQARRAEARGAWARTRARWSTFEEQEITMT